MREALNCKKISPFSSLSHFGFGSQGQQKSFLIALKLVQFDFIKKRSGVCPILLLDDIFDKLDERRVDRLIQLVFPGLLEF